MDVLIDKTLDAVLANGLDNTSFEFDQLHHYLNDDEPGCISDDFLSALALPVDREKEAAAIEALVKNVTMDDKLSEQQTTAMACSLDQPNLIPSNQTRKGFVYHNGYSHRGLPESPPDSGSENAYSPPDVVIHSLNNVPANISERSPPTPTMYPGVHSHPPSSKTFTSYLTEPPKLNHLQHPSLPIHQLHTPPCHNLLPSYPGMNLSQGIKKRKYSASPTGPINNNMTNMVIKQENPAYMGDCTEEDYTTYDLDSPNDVVYQQIKWQAYDPTTWATFCDGTYKELPTPSYRVDADKGFNMSVPDDAFVCQKKNHFQVSVQVGLAGHPKFVKTQTGYQHIDAFYLHFHGIKMEAQNQTIKVEQSQSDRSKRAFYPVEMNLGGDQVTKVTIGRLHFSETTTNNMRKKGKPNPDQRYFMLVVSLHAHCADQSHVVTAHVSEKLIVRASNPGQFENDMEVAWQKGQNSDSVYHIGRVGINTDHPDEALTVHGNLKVTGHVVQPSDQRVKENINEINSSEQLKNVSLMKIYEYTYTEQYSDTAGIDPALRRDTGVLAQEVRQVLPDAVLETGDVMLADGNCINKLLMVNKERIFMENVGAVKELCKLTDKMEYRIDELERMNKKLSRLKKYDSIKSTTSGLSVLTISTQSSVVATHQSKPKRTSHGTSHKSSPDKPPTNAWCSNRFIQTVIILLIIIMAFCLVSITVLYLLERQKTGSGTGDTHLQSASTNNSKQHGSKDGEPVAPKMSSLAPDGSKLKLSARPRPPTVQPVSKIVDIKEWPQCDLPSSCEAKCCIPFQRNPPKVHHGYRSGMGFKINRTHPTAVLQSNDIDLHDNTHQSDDSGYIAQNDHGTGQVRRKRRASSPISIVVTEMNFSLTENGRCWNEEECSLGNFTYKFQLKNTFSFTLNFTLEFSVGSLPLMVKRCVATQVADCSTKDSGERHKFSEDRPSVYPHDGNTTYRMSVPMGRYESEYYKFRLYSEPNLSPCEPDARLGGAIYQEYNLYFSREHCKLSDGLR